MLRRYSARLEAMPFPVKIKSKINVKGVGQECPTHMFRHNGCA